MKKLLLSVLLLCGVSYLSASEIPSSDVSVPAPFEYWGVDYATASFTAALTTTTLEGGTTSYHRGEFTVFGAEFSTGTCVTEFVDVFDSTNAWAAHNGNERGNIHRWYNVHQTTGNLSGTSAAPCAGFSGPKYPVRFRNGLMFRPSVATLNFIRIHYLKRKESER